MLRNYLKIALRNLRKNKSHTLINVGALTIGLVSAIIIFLIIRFEYSFDTHHEDRHRIYRVVRMDTEFDNIKYNAGVPYPLPAALRNDFPEIEALTLVDANFGTPVISVQHEDGSVQRFREENVAFVEPEYFDIFAYEWLMGDRRTALQQPNTVVISRSIAQQFFGDANPIGKSLAVQSGSTYDLAITGVVADPPLNTDMPFVVFASSESVTRAGDKRGNDNWNSVSTGWQCYVKLQGKHRGESIDARMDAFIAKYHDAEAAQTVQYFLQPLSALHFDTRFSNFRERVVPREMLFALALIGLFLLASACINFVNLNTALAVTRSKEVGVRKALGSTRTQMALSFLGETALITLLSFAAAFMLAEVAATAVEPLLGYPLPLELLASETAIFFLSGLFIITTLAAGLYPAFYLAGFNPIEALRNSINVSYGEGLALRRTLVVVQFAISQVLIISTIVISSQMNFFMETGMGFDEEAVVEVDIPVRDKVRFERFRNHLSAQSAIKSVALSNTGTAHGNTWGGDYELKMDEKLLEGNAQMKFIEPDFLKTYGIKLLAGSNLVKSDTVTQYLVNETFARENGFKNRYGELIGRYVEMWGREAQIAGVVNDFNTNSLHMEIEPVLLASRNLYFLAGIKIDMHRTQEALAAIEEAFNAAFPEYVFDYVCLDTRIENFYKKERQTGRMMNIFAGIAILIGCLGLFGLVSYMAATRSKEVGVRKVLGATVRDILLLFSKEFVLLLGVAFLCAAPLAYLAMNSWLAEFAYRMDLGPGLFASALLATLLIAVLTVGYKSLRTAAINPAEILKSE